MAILVWFELLQQTIIDQVAYEQQNFIPRRMISEIRVLARSSSGAGPPSSRLQTYDHILTWWKERVQASSLISSLRALILYTRAPPSSPNPFTKASPLNTITLLIRFQHMNLWEEQHKHSVHNISRTLSSILFKNNAIPVQVRYLPLQISVFVTSNIPFIH